MCCCGKPVINGQPGYRWQPNDNPIVHPVNPPDVPEGATILYDEPGRCGGLDSHCHHFRLVRESYGGLRLYVRHGGGDENIRVIEPITDAMAALDSNGRYWMLCAIYHAAADCARDSRNAEHDRWQRAVADKRVRTRKIRGGGGAVKVWIEDLPEMTQKVTA